MRLVVDLQCAHGPSRNRGIGIYSMSLLRALVRQGPDHDLIVVLNGNFFDSAERLRSELATILPSTPVRVMQIPDRVFGADAGNAARREAAELIREQFLSNLNPDAVLVCSLFEGLDDNVVTSIGRFGSSVLTATILYDLIPLINREIYLANPVICRWYEEKLAHLRRSDMLFAISESSRQEAIAWLNADPSSVVNISCAADERFTVAPVLLADEKDFRRRYGLSRPFVMYTGGIDYRKNIDGLIKAYARLSLDLRSAHQLVIVCAVEPSEKTRLKAVAAESGLNDDELVLTGYISHDDLVVCYRLCKLFIFPSWHEGFGLPVLEAMKCGRAALASNRSSLPEVIGKPEALFDPLNIDSIRDALAKVLLDDKFRNELENHSLQQAKKFDWDRTAQRTWDALVAAHLSRQNMRSFQSRPVRRPRLAYFSPLPPKNSGISDYSAELIPELARHYEIDVIVEQDSVSDPGIVANHPVRSVEWFRANFHRYDRRLFHFGNSEFHAHLFDLLQDFPGAVVLHDFFLSGIVAHRDLTGETPGNWTRELLDTVGWHAVKHRFAADDVADAIYAYPCNLSVLQNALGVIVHAEFPRRLARQFYGPDAGRDWHVIPHLRQPTSRADRAAARASFGFTENDFVVSSFGMLGPTKLNDRLLAAWLASPLAQDPNCHLVFVGENDRGDYGAELVRTIAAGKCAGTIKITGWTDPVSFRRWLAAADIGVQLRTRARGETSGTVLDCMNVGLPTIVNANGSMAELPPQCVLLLPEDFTDLALVEALTALRRDESRRTELGALARARIVSHHNPRQCAQAYVEAIEAIHSRSNLGPYGLEQRLLENGQDLALSDWPLLIKTMAANNEVPLRKPRLLVDVSELIQRDFGSGIQRVVRCILMQWLTTPPADYIVEPVYAILGQDGYRYARTFTSGLFEIDKSWCRDDVVEPMRGDVFVGLDLQPSVVAQQLNTYREWRRLGVIVRFVIYDLLPVVAPQYFMQGAQPVYHAWLEHISQSDGVVCISRAVVDDYCKWLQEFGPDRNSPLQIDWFHLGGDTELMKKSQPLPASSGKILERLHAAPSFLAVGTIEPRKGLRQSLAAMELLWAKGIDVNFVIVGNQGWLMDDFVNTLLRHREAGKRLFWLKGISDTYLHAIYEACRCLIAPSVGEGFGLPLIEAAHHDLPILARDLPVFREVAGDAVDYFPNSDQPETIALAVEVFLKKPKASLGRPPVAFLTWAESAASLLSCVFRETPPYRCWMRDHRTHH